MTDADPTSPADGQSPDAADTSATETRGEDHTGHASGTDALLAVDNLDKRVGGITALDRVSINVEQGITGLIGPNGAGKTTLFKCITGFLDPDAEQVRFDGTDITGDRPATLTQKGLVRSFQIPRELESMTVENLLLATPNQYGERLTGTWRRGERFAAAERRDRRRAAETAEFFELDHLLDEPMAGVNPSLQRKILDRIHELEEQGYAFLLVEHDIDVITENCERVIVLHQGEVLMEGPPEAVRTDERVIEAYLGEEEI
jgi:branched-chain amino acid transport system ATP-binding protein